MSILVRQLKAPLTDWRFLLFNFLYKIEQIHLTDHLLF